jgi:hypothetical protein
LGAAGSVVMFGAELRLIANIVRGIPAAWFH